MKCQSNWGYSFIHSKLVRGLLVFLALVASTSAGAGGSLIDSHVHYNADHAAHWPVVRIVEILDTNHISHAAVTSRPPGLVMELRKHAPEKIVPVLGVYQHEGDKQDWHRNPQLPKQLKKHLQQYDWAAISELHLFARHRGSQVFYSIMELAGQYELPVLLHADPAVIDRVYENFPKAKIIWAHAGAYPYPDLLKDYLNRYPSLVMDLSMRNQRIAPAGELDAAWEELFFEHPDQLYAGGRHLHGKSLG